MRRTAAILRLLATAAIVSHGAAANANGRFPRSQQVLVDPENPSRLYVAGTYGLLRTIDRGKTWGFLCEEAFAKNPLYSGDPLLAFAGDRSLLADVQIGLHRSPDDGCSWTGTLGGGQERVIDFAVARSNPSIVFAVVANYEARVVHQLYQSQDDGRSWTAIGVPLPLGAVYTVDVSPIDPARVYATGLDGQRGQFATSSDRGATWTVRAIPDTDANRLPFIAAVHPTDPRRIFVRTSGLLPDTTPLASDALLYSDDEGLTWSTPIVNGAKLLGFALSPDGSTVLIGYGDPGGDAGKVTGGLGLYRSSTDVFSFTRVLEANIHCLAWTNDGVYVCASRDAPQAELFFAPDGARGADAGCWTRLLRLGDVRGPIACVASTCAASWDVTCQALGACRDGGAPAGEWLPACMPDASIADAWIDGSPPDVSMDGAETVGDAGLDAAVRRDADGHDANHDGSAATGDGGSADAGPPIDDGAACGCRQVGAGKAPLSLGLAFLLALGRRRHPRRRSSEQ